MSRPWLKGLTEEDLSSPWEQFGAFESWLKNQFGDGEAADRFEYDCEWLKTHLYSVFCDLADGRFSDDDESIEGMGMVIGTRCKHWRSDRHYEDCKVGIAYHDRETATRLTGFCRGHQDADHLCDRFALRTEAEEEEYLRDMKMNFSAATAKMMTVLDRVRSETDGDGEMDCPVCGKSTIIWRRSGNGDSVNLYCGTDGCVSMTAAIGHWLRKGGE